MTAMTDRANMSREQLLALVEELEAQYRARDLECTRVCAEQSERFAAEVRELGGSLGGGAAGDEVEQ